MKLLTITTTMMPNKKNVIKVGSIVANREVSFDEAVSIIEEAVVKGDTDVLEAFKFGFCIDLDGMLARNLIVSSIMPFAIDILIKEEYIEFTSTGLQLRNILQRWLVMNNIYLQKMGASIVLDLIHAELVFLIRDILDDINRGEDDET